MPSLEEAIADAATELTKEADKDKETKPGKTLAPEIGTDDTEEEQIQEHESGNEGQESDASQEDELDDASKDEALRLYKALKDPKAGPAVLAALAQQAGLLGKNTPETKTEVREAKKAITEILEDSLPENMKFLAKQLGPAIEKVFESEREEQNEKFQQIEIQRVENQVIEAYKRLARDTKGDSVKLEARMAEISKKISPAPDVSVNEYIDYLYQIASGGKGTQVSSSRQVADRIRRNANDLPSRLRTTTGSSDDKDWIPKKAIGLKGSVELALQQLAKQRK